MKSLMIMLGVLSIMSSAPCDDVSEHIQTDYLIAETHARYAYCPYSDDEIDLLTRMCMSEAEGESEYGQRLVVDSVLNRIDNSEFPDSVYDVIYQPNQYTVTKRTELNIDIRKIVVEECQNRVNYDVIFFRTNHYSEYGTPMFCEGGHYFSSYGND